MEKWKNFDVFNCFNVMCFTRDLMVAVLYDRVRQRKLHRPHKESHKLINRRKERGGGVEEDRE